MSKKKLFGLPLPLVAGVLVFLLLLLFFGILGGPIGQSLAQTFPFLQPLVNLYPESLVVEKPEISLAPQVIFYIGSWPITNTMVTAWITIAIIILISYLAFRKPKIIPAGLQKVMEYIYVTLLNFCISVAGEKNGRRFFPFVATIFLYVIVNAYLGLLPFWGDALWITGANGEPIPFLRAANTDINVPLAIALFAWVSIETFGIGTHGFFRYVKKFIKVGRIGQGFKNLFHGKVKTALGDFFFGAIDAFVGFLEFMSECIRIVSFTFRLFGNMTAGEVLILVVGFLTPLVLGAVVYGMEMFFGFLQALIFGGLTLVWMTMAVEGEEDEVHSA